MKHFTILTILFSFFIISCNSKTIELEKCQKQVSECEAGWNACDNLLKEYQNEMIDIVNINKKYDNLLNEFRKELKKSQSTIMKYNQLYLNLLKENQRLKDEIKRLKKNGP
jgi:peptidoglycan hydrolase CwlO-like protein